MLLTIMGWDEEPTVSCQQTRDLRNHSSAMGWSSAHALGMWMCTLGSGGGIPAPLLCLILAFPQNLLGSVELIRMHMNESRNLVVLQHSKCSVFCVGITDWLPGVTYFFG